MMDPHVGGGGENAAILLDANPSIARNIRSQAGERESLRDKKICVQRRERP